MSVGLVGASATIMITFSGVAVDSDDDVDIRLKTVMMRAMLALATRMATRGAEDVGDACGVSPVSPRRERDGNPTASEVA